MPNLSFFVEGVEEVTFAAAPLLSFKLKIRNGNPEERIQSIGLRCQVQIEATKRRYSEAEQEKLFELFGEPERWGRTLRAMLWSHASAMVPPFQGETIIDLHVPCTFDFNIAATKYFAGLEDGIVPLNLMFSGTVFYVASDGELQVYQIPWDKESDFKLPITVWQRMMDHYYPNSAWLCLRRDVFEGLSRYKRDHGIATWEQVFENLLPPPVAVVEEEIAIKGSLPS